MDIGSIGCPRYAFYFPKSSTYKQIFQNVLELCVKHSENKLHLSQTITISIKKGTYFGNNNIQHPGQKLAAHS